MLLMDCCINNQQTLKLWNRTIQDCQAATIKTKNLVQKIKTINSQATKSKIVQVTKNRPAIPIQKATMAILVGKANKTNKAVQEIRNKPQIAANKILAAQKGRIGIMATAIPRKNSLLNNQIIILAKAITVTRSIQKMTI